MGSRAERRRIERELKRHKNVGHPVQAVPEYLTASPVSVGILKGKIARETDEKLGSKYMDMALKENDDIKLEILAPIMALAIKDVYPEFGQKRIGRLIQAFVDKRDEFVLNYDCDLDQLKKDCEERTGLTFEFDGK